MVCPDTAYIKVNEQLKNCFCTSVPGQQEAALICHVVFRIRGNLWMGPQLSTGGSVNADSTQGFTEAWTQEHLALNGTNHWATVREITVQTTMP